MLLTELPRPFIVAVATDRTVAGMLQTIERAVREGADAIELNLPAVADVLSEELEEMLAKASLPVYTTCRRRQFMTVYGFDAGDLPNWPDEERMERQLAALHFGSVAIDMELDTFDPCPPPPLGSPEAARFAAEPGAPAELTHDRDAVEKQRGVVSEAHTAGAQVLLSCHTGRPQTAGQLMAIGQEAADRGADLLKIVSPCRDAEDLAHLYGASRTLSASLPIPFVLVGSGTAGLESRTEGWRHGSSWIIAQVERVAGGFQDQPLVVEAKGKMHSARA
ncbi:MAG: type I 3-dehydroquinate dehydratase [Thermomicrobiales bacterium]